MKHIRTSALCAALLSSAAVGVLPSSTAAQSIEVMHFWVSAGETEALEVFADAFRENGGEWAQVAAPTMLSMRRRAIERIVMGFPPTAIQWHAGPELDELLTLDLIRPLDDVTDADDLRSRLNTAVVDAVTRDGTLAALPVGIHGENWAWYNKPIYEKLGFDIPAGWSEFLEQAPAIADAGYEPLALGGWDWQIVLLFKTVLIDIAGKPAFIKMLTRAQLSEEEREKVAEAVDVFRALREFTSPKPETPRTWIDGTNRVIDGGAALQIMGDWAKGAFLAAGKKPGIDFECRLAPGNDDTSVIVLDVFVLAAGNDETAKKAQAAFVETLLDPENQIAFAKAKGALPVIRSFDRSTLDQCARLGLEKFDQPGLTVPSVLSAYHFDQKAVMDAAVVRLWDDKQGAADEIAEAFIKKVFD